MAMLTVFSVQHHYMLSKVSMLYVRLSVTRFDQSKTAEVRIMKFSPNGRSIPLVFALLVEWQLVRFVRNTA